MTREGKKSSAAKGRSPMGPKPPSAHEFRPLASGFDSRTLLICVALAVITLALYWRVHEFEFVNFDDLEYVVENSHVQQGLTLSGMVWALTGTQVSNWHPLTMLSLMLNRELFGMAPASFHVVNLLIHVVNGLLVFLVLKKITGAFWRSAMVAALFAWHPLHIESVAWVSERKDVLSGFFWLATLWAYARYVEREERGRYVLTLVLFALGLMSKPMVVTLPFVLLLLDYWPFRRMDSRPGGGPGKTWAQLVSEKAPFFALCVAASVVTFAVQQKSGAVATTGSITPGERAINAVVSYERYLEKAVWPANLSVFYPYPRAWPVSQVMLAVVVIALLTGLAIRLVRKAPYLIAGWCLYLGMLVPVVGLVQVGSQSMADRYTYLPLLGIFVMAVWGAADLLLRIPNGKSMLSAVAAGCLVVCAAISWRQLGYWQNSLVLLQHAIQVTEKNEFAHNLLGVAFLARDRYDEAAAHFEESIRLQPGNFDVQYNLGSVLAKQGKVDDAMKRFDEALRLKPDYFEAQYNLAGIYFQKGDWSNSVAHYTEAARLKPDSIDAEYNLATALRAGGQLEPAAAHFASVLRLNPGHGTARVNLGFILSKLGRTSEAIAQFNEALRINPDFVLALYQLGWLRATDDHSEFRNGAEAVRLAERACILSGWQQAAMLDALAAAYAEAGRFPEAVKAEERALALAEGKESPALLEVMRRRQALFQSGNPYHAPAR